MFKKILFLFVVVAFFGTQSYSQAVTVTNISSSGHFANTTTPSGCGLGLPVVTAQFLSGTGTTISGGVIQCTDPCGTTTVRITLTNVRWSKNPDQNWLHGISFTPGNVTVNVPTGGLPAGWISAPSSTGSCSTGITTGQGFYFDGTSSHSASCCTNISANDGIPNNNFGDVLADCGFDYTFFFDLTFCNSSITNNPLVFSARGTSDYQTGCWTGVDNIGTSRIQFVLSTTPCTVPIFSTLPTAAAPVKTCNGGNINYTSTLTSSCGSGANVTWWTAATGGIQLGSGSPFIYDPAGSACPAGTTLYAACCPNGSTCATRRAFLIPGVCAPALAITNVATTNPSCSTPTGSINGVTVTGNAGTVFYTINPGNITNSTGVFTGLTGLSYTLTAADDAGCSVSVPVTFTPTPGGGIPPTVTSPVSYCQGQTTGVVPISATAATGGTLTYFLPTGGAGLTTAPTPSTTTTGTFTYTVTQIVGGCTSAAIPIVVNINPTPAAPTVSGTPVQYCQGATAVALTATASTGATLNWYGTNATGGAASATATIPSTTAAGSLNYYVSQSIGTCESPRSLITVNVTATPAAPSVSGTPVQYCQGSTATALIATAATGATLNWYGTNATGGTASATATIPSTAAAGSLNYYVSQSIGSCEGPRAMITVNVTATPAAPTVSSTPLQYCQGATAIALTAMAATGATLNWYGTNATAGTASPTAVIPSTTAGGSLNYYVSQSIGSCEGPRAMITVNVTATPATPTVSSTPLQYCQGATPVALTATAVTGATLNWYGTNATGGTASATATIPSTVVVGSINYYVSQSIGSCEGPRAVITVNVIATPAAPTVSSTPLQYCQGATGIALTATAATGATLNWYGTNATGGTASPTAVIPSTTAGGSLNYYVSQSIGSCEGTRAMITVNVTATPATPTVSSTPLQYCQGGTAVALTATAATGATLNWYGTNATGGTSSATAPIPSTTAAGSINYYVSQTLGSCEGPRAMITVNVTATPAAPTVLSTPVQYCQGATATALSATAATGAILNWYGFNATGGTASASPTIPSTTAAGSTNYYVSQRIGNCEGPRALITVNVSPALTVNAGSNVTIAAGTSTQLNATVSPSGTYNYLWTTTGPLALSANNILNPVASPLQTTVYLLTVTNPLNLCSYPGSVTVTVVANCINVKNAFTPNGDGINDMWIVYDQAFCLKPGGVTVNVFNRYGSKVFESKNYTNTWDGTYKGKPVPDGTYFAVVEFLLLDGSKKTVRTDVTVLR